MKREESTSVAFKFPVFDKVNTLYPNRYKYIAKKYDSTDTFCVLLYNTTANGNDTPIILTCNPQNIVNTLTLPNGTYYGRQFATINNYLFFVYGTSNYDYKVRIYDKETLLLIRESRTIKNWLTGSPFCALVNNKHYFSTTTNSSTNCYAVVCAEDGSVSRTESGNSFIGCYVKHDIENSTYYNIRYYINTYDDKHAPVMYSDSSIFGSKTWNNPISNEIPLSEYPNSGYFVSFPSFAYKDGETMDTYTGALTNGGMAKVQFSDNFTTISFGTTYEHNVDYNILSFGALMNGEEMYTMDLETKDIVFKKLKKI